MLVATVALAAVSVWALVGMTRAQNALATAQREGSDSVEVLSAANVLLSRAQGDLSLTLVNRGTDTTDPADFTAAMRALTTPGLAARARLAIRRIPERRPIGSRSSKVADSSKPQSSGAQGVAKMSEQLSDALTGQIDAAQARFARHARDAASALSGLGLAIPLITVLAAVLSLLGLRQRINEYR